MSDLTTGDLKLLTHISTQYLDYELWSALPVDMLALALKRSRADITESITRLVEHGAIEASTADIVIQDPGAPQTIDRGFDVYRLT